MNTMGFANLSPSAARRANKHQRRRGATLSLLRLFRGGRSRIRTCDPCRVKAVLYR